MQLGVSVRPNFQRHRFTMAGPGASNAPKQERTLKRRVRPLLTQVQAACRLMILTGARLTEKERAMMLRLFYNAGVMRDVNDVSNALSSIGINVALDDLSCYLDRVNFEAGTILDWQQFAKLARYVKRRFIMESEIPDSQVAFVALGGETNLSGDIETEKLRFICQSEFRLTIDIDAFIEEHDEDGSGKLSFSEFSAMFHETDDGNGGNANRILDALSGGPHGAASKAPDGTSGNAEADGMSAKEDGGVAADSAGAANSTSPNAAVGATTATGQDAKPQEPGDLQPQVVFDGCQQWAESNPIRPESRPNGTKSKKHRKQGAAGDETTEPSSPMTAPSTAHQEQSQSKKERKALWVRGDEEVAKQKLQDTFKTAETAQVSFGYSKRFPTDKPFEPLPPPRGAPNVARISRPHFRDGPPLPLSARQRAPLLLPSLGGSSSSHQRPAPETARKWFEVDPFFVNETDLAADVEARDREAARQRRPILARVGASSVVCQPEMAF